MKFKIKSNWYDNKQIYTIGSKGFYIYTKLRTLEYRGMENKTAITINQLYRLISQHCKVTKQDIITYIRNMKKAKIINYERIPTDNEKLIWIDFLDTPLLKKENNKETPVTNEDNYLVVDTDIIETLLSKGLTIDEVSVYQCLRKYINTEQITLGCETIEDYININKDKVNKILHKLHKYKIINYGFTTSQRNRKCNRINILCNTNEEINNLTIKN